MKVNLSEQELEMASKLLDEYSDVLGDRICNDHWIEDTDENWELIDKINKWNSSNPKEWDSREDLSSKDGLYIPNYMLPSYLSYRLKNASSLE